MRFYNRIRKQTFKLQKLCKDILLRRQSIESLEATVEAVQEGEVLKDVLKIKYNKRFHFILFYIYIFGQKKLQDMSVHDISGFLNH